MIISKNPYYLVTTNNSDFKVTIEDNISDCLNEWGHLSRVSPIFFISKDKSLSPTIDLSDSCSLIYTGPFPIHKYPEFITNECELWLTFGLYNSLIITDKKDLRNKALDYLKDQEVRYEVWQVNDNIISDIDHVDFIKNGGLKYDQKLKVFDFPNIKPAIQEYLFLSNTCFFRSQNLGPFRDEYINDLKLIDQVLIDDLVTDLENEKISRQSGLSVLTIINAGLSRFASQTFSGTSPINSTENHYWSHSLMGIGLANLALLRLRDFIAETFGEFRLVQKFEKLKHIEQKEYLHNINNKNKFWYKEIIENENTELQQEDLDEPIVPTITFFSGRDGFRSYTHTLSAPLESIHSCNSLEWSLMTITHEICHNIIRGILGLIYPNFDNDHEIDKILAPFKSETTPSNLFEHIQFYFFYSLLSLDLEVDKERSYNRISFKNQANLWYREIEEIMVHTLDYMYFYGFDVQKYIESIWVSWSAIPDINDRIPEYVLRSISSISVNYLRKSGDPVVLAIEAFSEALKNIRTDKISTESFINEAKKYLKEADREKLEINVLKRIPFAKITHSFTYAETLSNDLLKEPFIHSGAEYNFDKSELPTTKFGNPIKFIESYCSSVKPSISESIWFYYSLVFGYERK